MLTCSACLILTSPIFFTKSRLFPTSQHRGYIVEIVFTCMFPFAFPLFLIVPWFCLHPFLFVRNASRENETRFVIYFIYMHYFILTEMWLAPSPESLWETSLVSLKVDLSYLLGPHDRVWQGAGTRKHVLTILNCFFCFFWIWYVFLFWIKTCLVRLGSVDLWLPLPLGPAIPDVFQTVGIAEDLRWWESHVDDFIYLCRQWAEFVCTYHNILVGHSNLFDACARWGLPFFLRTGSARFLFFYMGLDLMSVYLEVNFFVATL